MRFAIRLMLPMLAVALLAVTFTGQSAIAEDMTAKGKITGTVTKDGQPLAGAEVRLVKPRGGAATQPTDGGKPPKMTPVATGKTDDKGAFTLDDVPVGKYNVQVGSKKDGRGTAKVEVAAGETATVTVTVEAAKPN